MDDDISVLNITLHFIQRSLVCIILWKLEENGFSVMCSADVSARYESRQYGYGYPVDVHSWFAVRSGARSSVDSAKHQWTGWFNQ
uniref:Uncharacterized protein n=1 Tax=Romanomermis culicivorax TaxID=13658 RepID=A0A915K0W1_ROMCU